ncbi:MAG: RHS repeat-associated core domain-containing protein [Nanoarchaeota archaeon]
MRVQHNYGLLVFILVVAIVLCLVFTQPGFIGEGFKVASVGGGGSKTEVVTQRVVPAAAPMVSVEVFDPMTISVVASRDVSVPSSQTHYTHAFGVLSSTTDGEKQYHIQDYLGSTRATTSFSGMQSSSIDVLPFGETLRSGAASGGGSRYGFTEKEQDISSDLHYFGARYMDSLSGRFTSVDPLQKNDQSAYTYVGNRPLDHIDPSGEFAIPILFALEELIKGLVVTTVTVVAVETANPGATEEAARATGDLLSRVNDLLIGSFLGSQGYETTINPGRGASADATGFASDQVDASIGRTPGYDPTDFSDLFPPVPLLPGDRIDPSPPPLVGTAGVIPMDSFAYKGTIAELERGNLGPKDLLNWLSRLPADDVVKKGTNHYKVFDTSGSLVTVLPLNLKSGNARNAKMSQNAVLKAARDGRIPVNE